jgi:hypothetical protein
MKKFSDWQFTKAKKKLIYLFTMKQPVKTLIYVNSIS